MVTRNISTFLHGRNAFYVSLLLLPPLLWLGTVYLGSLFTLLLQSFYSIDEFTARVVPTLTLAHLPAALLARRTSTSCCALWGWRLP